MMNNKEEIIAKLKGKGFGKKSPWLENAKKRKAQRTWQDKSFKVAVHILSTLKQRGLKKKDLAEMMEVSPQQVSKWLKGTENFTFETIGKLETVLGITLVDVEEYKVYEWNHKTNDKPIYYTVSKSPVQSSCHPFESYNENFTELKYDQQA